jgi:hypothetical protein
MLSMVGQHHERLLQADAALLARDENIIAGRKLSWVMFVSTRYLTFLINYLSVF